MAKMIGRYVISADENGYEWLNNTFDTEREAAQIGKNLGRDFHIAVICKENEGWLVVDGISIAYMIEEVFIEESEGNIDVKGELLTRIEEVLTKWGKEYNKSQGMYRVNNLRFCSHGGVK